MTYSHELVQLAQHGAQLFLLGRALKRRARQVACLMVVGGTLVCNAVPSRTDGNSKRSFTIKDSIEMSYIVDVSRRTDVSLQAEHPLGSPVNSPDNKYFLLVTQRGILSSNALEGTIWLFDRERVLKYASGRTTTKPVPRRLVTMAATSNTPVIYDVRWVDGSNKVAFLGKDRSPYQQIFVADVETGSVRAVTKKGFYVTAYDMRGETTVYTVWSQEPGPTRFDRDFIDVGDRNVFELIYRDPPALEDIYETVLLQYSSSLHVQKGGKEIPTNFTMQGRRLELFIPTLTLSPDAKFLITVAPVREIPRDWEQYQTLFEDRRLKAGPARNTNASRHDIWRPEQYVTVDLETGSASPLVDAPAGRDLGYALAPTEAFWLDDNRHLVLTNTYLPLSASLDEMNRAQRSRRAAVTLLDISTKEIQANIPLENQYKSDLVVYLDDIAWNAATCELRLHYMRGRDNELAPAPETYDLRSDKWVKIQERGAGSPDDVDVFVRQDLNHPPTLGAHARGGQADWLLVWDPNPQFEALKIGKASVYGWQDKKGRQRSGILALPPDYDANHRYPLVIQTHGYDKNKFFVDGGLYNTGTGGRALGARGIAVLQMDEYYSTAADEAPENLAAFESAVDQLVADGLVDRSRVGVIGFSRTTFHVRYALIHHPDLFRAASITDGFDASYVIYVLMGPTRPGASAALAKQVETINGGMPYGDGSMNWVRNANGFNLDKIQAPLLISGFMRGGLFNDWETYVGLRRLNKPVEYLWWWKGNTPHMLVQPNQRFASQEAAVDWFDFWLNDHEKPESANAEQYVRWRELRKLQADNQASTNSSTSVK